ncbi:cytochrome P450 3A24-like [Centruroides sculpturatus]|uniref:cytochrome P450 3A24-like n=1 Tax=Centruroides sculpturatus TaxID=218467 RepID=UPI000C6D0F9F|nr:cytochrome P450 3A24-like [Centruroides sculpturatus]
MEIIIILISTVLLLIFASWFRKQRQRMTYFKRIGVPGPPPHFITGNMKEIDEKGLAECHRLWIEKYGKIVGYYIGCRPFILTSDIELLKLIQIKYFSDFNDRKVVVPKGTMPSLVSGHSIVANRGGKWKKNRSIITPTFTSGKLKQMYSLMESSVEDFLQLLNKYSLRNVDIHKLYTKLSMDVIGKTNFGIKTDVQFNNDSSFVHDCEFAVSFSLADPSVRISVYFPDTSPVVFILRVLHDNLRYLFKLPSVTRLIKTVNDVIKARKLNKQKRCDLIQLMIDNGISNEQLRSTDIQTLTADSTSTKANKEISFQENTEQKLHRMTNKEIQGNSLIFFLAGHHTTSTCLTYTTFLLATHQDIQENLRQELLNVFHQKEELTYDDIMNLSYMDQVVSESLRIYPPVISFVTRKSNIEFRYKDYVFPKNTAFQAAIWVLHRDPELWEDPLDFKPDRFSPENKSNMGISYQPFGAGPRNCVGMRFALLEIKLILVKLLLNYRILPSSETNLDVEYKVSVTAPKSGMFVRLVPLSIQKP